MTHATDFSPLTFDVMNDIASLLHVAQSMFDISETFNLPVIDRDEVKPHADHIIGFARTSSAEMLKIMFRREGVRAKQVSIARKEALSKLPEVLASALHLVKIEKKALGEVGAKGNFLQHRVLTPLQQLQSKWEAS